MDGCKEDRLVGSSTATTMALHMQMPTKQEHGAGNHAPAPKPNLNTPSPSLSPLTHVLAVLKTVSTAARCPTATA